MSEHLAKINTDGDLPFSNPAAGQSALLANVKGNLTIDSNRSTDYHRIRLHGPWQAELISSIHPVAKGIAWNRKVHIPVDWGEWLGNDFCGQVSFERAFGCPSSLEPGQPVWLNVKSVEGLGKVSLNKTEIGGVDDRTPLRVRIEHLLKSSNRLHIAIEMPVDYQVRLGKAGGLTGSVYLEIDETTRD